MMNYKFRLHDDKYNIMGYEVLDDKGISYLNIKQEKCPKIKGYSHRFPLARLATIKGVKKERYEVYVGDTVDVGWTSTYNDQYRDRAIIVQHAKASAYKCICIARSTDYGKSFQYRNSLGPCWSLSCVKQLRTKPEHASTQKMPLELAGIGFDWILARYAKE